MAKRNSSSGAQAEEDGRLFQDWLHGKVAADDDQAVLEYIIMRAREKEDRKAQDEDCKAAVEFILENLDEWRADLRIEDPYNVSKEHATKLQRVVRVYYNSIRCFPRGCATGDTLFMFFMDAKRVVRMIGQAYGIRGAELVNADASIRYNAWEDLLAAVTIKESLPQWSRHRTPKQWCMLLKEAGQAYSDSTWRNLRKEHADQMDGSKKSVRISRALADKWGLKLPEFTEGTSN